MIKFFTKHMINLIWAFYFCVIFFVFMLIFKSCSYGMFSVQNKTNFEDYKKHIPLKCINPLYSYEETYIHSFRIRMILEKAHDDISWMNNFGNSFSKIEIPYKDKTSVPHQIQDGAKKTSHITAYVTSTFKTETKNGKEESFPVYVGFSELSFPMEEEVKRVRLLFYGLNDDFEPIIDFEVNEKHNIINATRSVGFIPAIEKFKDIIMK